MAEDEIVDLIAGLRRIGGEPERIEAKRATGGLPTSLRETLSAFSNTDGGVVLLGVDEQSGFSVVELPDATALRDALVQMSRDDLTPPIRIATEVVEVEGRLVVVGEVPPVPWDQRPVYVTSKGVSNGSFLRSGDGDRRMVEAEVGLLYANRTQPRYDAEIVPGTSLSDLDIDSVRRTLERVRRGSASLARVEDNVALTRIGVLAEPNDDSQLTLAGLLVFGAYPQQYFPQLMCSLVVHAPEGVAGETRFLDNATLRGPIPEIVDSALAMMRRNLAARAVMSDTGRTDKLEFPLGVVREALVNALMHRDYSGITRGTQVQVELFPDRLEIRSPGGIYGGIAVEDLGEEAVSSSRNAVLASLLADTYMPTSREIVAENRSSGIPTMIALTRDNGLPRPSFRSSVSSFVVTVNRSQLLAQGVLSWISGLRIAGLTPAHEIALAMMRAGVVTNAALRQWGVDRIQAGQVLRDLVEWGVAVKEGGRRYATYVLDPRARDASMLAVPKGDSGTGETPTKDQVAHAVRAGGDEVSAQDIEAATGLSRPTIVKYLRDLIEAGVVTPIGPARSPRRRYRWSGRAIG
ncbi:ATP-binding protein [Promicromonospora sp. NPDC023987]|uniref:ATP-binding protein n=1 Tax=Promicromonospora sp. NPDC023987 TaxID=3155360 RepID=UPI00340F4378